MSEKKAQKAEVQKEGQRPPSAGFKQLGRAFRYLRNYRNTAVIAVAALLISIFAQLLVPQMIQRILDAVAQGLALQQSGSVAAQETAMAVALQALSWSIALIVLFAVARGVFAFTQAFSAEKMSQGIAFDLRNDLFAKIQRLSFSYHDRNRTGQLMVRATDDVEKLRIFLGQGLLMLLQAVVLLVGALTLLIISNWRLTLVVLPILPIAFALFMTFGAISQPLFRKVQIKISALNTVLQESLAGIRVIKAFAREPHQQASFEHAADEAMHQQIAVARVMSFIFPLIFTVGGLGQVAILYFGGRQIIDSTLTIGEWQKFSIYLWYVFFPMGQLGFIIGQMSQASASADRIFEILDAQNEVMDRPGAQPLPAIQGEVEFRDVTFRYFNSGEPVLDAINFRAESGTTVALLGATGSGKTTIINLIPRFYDVSEGALLIDGYDVREVTIESLRRQIGIVLQETNLFTGSIRENIAFGRPDATDEEVSAAAQAAAAHDFIMQMPEGYATPVGERGTTLSGGQKQRIAIARALLLDPAILILDDSTSSVDVATEARIQHALDKLMEGRTSFVIAQRISTVLNADQILVLENGRIVAQGRHAELMESSPAYVEIYRSQLVEDAVAPADEAAAVTVG
ncbi:MAG: ABC transporter ATP-binding protein [Caldilineaceae bacterium]|nr:ABC transporter ATP-binding protein [Caldilineaceae bacterium]